MGNPQDNPSFFVKLLEKEKMGVEEELLLFQNVKGGISPNLKREILGWIEEGKNLLETCNLLILEFKKFQ